MEQVDKDTLAQLSMRYGDYAVAQVLAENAVLNSSTMYANNPGAVIHRDAASLSKAVQAMKMNHPLRYMDT